MVHFELKIMPLVTQNQQLTIYLCHNWNSELTLYEDKQKFIIIIIIIIYSHTW